MVPEHELKREVTFWRHLLTSIAQDMEQTASVAGDQKWTRWLQSRAKRVRERLDEGVPSRWTRP